MSVVFDTPTWLDRLAAAQEATKLAKARLTMLEDERKRAELAEAKLDLLDLRIEDARNAVEDAEQAEYQLWMSHYDDGYDDGVLP